MKRRHDARRKASQEVWTCQNPDCHIIVNIGDDMLQVNHRASFLEYPASGKLPLPTRALTLVGAFLFCTRVLSASFLSNLSTTTALN
jgi:hypothetical protein